MRLQRFKKNRTKSADKSSFVKIILALFFLCLTILSFFLFTKRNYPKNQSRLSVAVNENDFTKVVVFDTTKNEVVLISIPNSVEVESAGGYGVLKLKNVWKLSESENKPKLVANTLTKYFLIPTDTSSSTSILALVSGNVFTKIKVIFNSMGDLTFADRLNLFVYSLRSPSIKEFDLHELKALTKTTLKDGSEGYIKSGDLPQIITYYLSDPLFEKKDLKIKIENSSENRALSESIKAVTEAIGGHVLFIEKNPMLKIPDCQISYLPANHDEAKHLSRLINCSHIKLDQELTFDIVISFGADYINTF